MSSKYEDIKEKISGRLPSEIVNINYNGIESKEYKRRSFIRTIPIAIGIPLDEVMFSKFFANYTQLNIMPWDDIFTTQNTLVGRARNTIHNMFLESSNAPYLFMLDSDVLPPPDSIETLISHNLPIVGGYYRNKENLNPVVFDYDSEVDGHKMYRYRLEPGTGIESVDAMGAGFWLIKREVAESVGKSPYSFEEGGEDMDFCRKVIKAGYKIYADWDLSAGHAGIASI